MVGWVRTLRSNGFDNIGVVQTNLETFNAIPMYIKDIGLN